jgi:hypothetical protein
LGDILYGTGYETVRANEWGEELLSNVGAEADRAIGVAMHLSDRSAFQTRSERLTNMDTLI